MLSFTIIGRPISKKNSRRFIRRGRATISLPSEAYKKYELSIIEQSSDWGAMPDEATAIILESEIHMKGNMGSRTDLSNMVQGIEDALERAGVIANDVLIHEHRTKKFWGASDWKAHVKLIPASKDDYKSNE